MTPIPETKQDGAGFTYRGAYVSGVREVISVARQIVTRLRIRLDASTIGLYQTLRSWLRAGLIEQLDQMLTEPSRE